MEISTQSIDVSNVLPQGIDFEINQNNYMLIYSYRALKRLSDIYGSVGKAIDALRSEDKYDTTVNFLFAGLCDKYKLKKSDIEDWVGPNSVHLFYNIVFNAVIKAFGTTKNDDDSAEEMEQGEP